MDAEESAHGGTRAETYYPRTLLSAYELDEKRIREAIGQVSRE